MSTHTPAPWPESPAFAAAIARIADLHRESAAAGVRRSARLGRPAPARWPTGVVAALRDSLHPAVTETACPAC